MNHRLIPTIFYSCSSEKSANSQKMAEKNNDIHVEIALKVMAKLKIEQRNGILAITIQENRTGNVDTMIIDCEKKEMLELYPSRYVPLCTIEKSLKSSAYSSRPH